MTEQNLRSFFEKNHENVKKADDSYVRIMTSNLLHSRASELAKKTWEERVSILSAVYPTTPIFLTGDYNAKYTERQMQVLFDGLSMTSGALVAEKSDGMQMFNHPISSMDFFAPNQTSIDHVGVTTDLCDVKLHRVLLDEVIAKGSDHCPMFIDVAIKSEN